MAAEILPKLDRFARILPILRWLPGYEARWFRADVIAGLTLWGMVVPEAIAYAGLAGAPVQAGLYTLLASLVAYAILGTTRQAVSAPTSGSDDLLGGISEITFAIVIEKSDFAFGVQAQNNGADFVHPKLATVLLALVLFIARGRWLFGGCFKERCSRNQNRSRRKAPGPCKEPPEDLSSHRVARLCF